MSDALLHGPPVNANLLFIWVWTLLLSDVRLDTEYAAYVPNIISKLLMTLMREKQ